MFGDNLIIGHTYSNLDDKGRLFLPKFTNAEANDRVIIEPIIIDDNLSLKVHPFDKYLIIINRYKSLIDNAKSIEEMKRYSLEYEKLCLKLESIIKVDRQKRILLAKNTLDRMNWQQSSTLQLDGLGNSLLIRKK